MSNEYLMLQGQLYLAQRAGSLTPSQFRPMGNAPAITVGLGGGALPQPYSLPSGARPVTLLSNRSSNEQPTITFDLENVTRENLALALYGTEYTTAGGTVPDEQFIVNKAMTSFLSCMNITAWTSLRNSAGTVTYVPGKDYEIDLRFGAITFPVGSAIADGSTVRATYDHGGSSGVHPYRTIPAPVWLRFAGVNQVTQEPVLADFYKVQFKPLDSLGLIDNDAKAISLTGVILRDYHNAGDPADNRLFALWKA